MATYPVHRNGDLRDCGATTIVEGQDFVFINEKLWAVENDPETHGDGNLIPSHTGIYINGKRVIVHTPDQATADDVPHVPPLTETAEGSPNVYAYK